MMMIFHNFNSNKTHPVMTYLSALIALLALPLSFNKCNANSWVQKANYNGSELVYQFTFTLDDKCFFGCGTKFDSIGPNSYSRDFWMFDPVTNTYTQEADFGGTARANAVGFSIKGKGYAGPYSGASFSTDFWEYDFLTNAWNQKTAVPLPLLAGFEHISFSTLNYGYVLTIGNGNPASLWQYNPTNDSWQVKSPCPISLRGAMHFSIGSNLFFGVGVVDTSGSNLYSNEMYRYHETIDQWTQVSNFPGLTRWYGSSFSIAQKGYVGMGRGPSWPLYYTDFWEYDLQTNSWQQAASFSGPPRDIYLSFSTATHGYAGIGSVDAVFPNLYFNDLWEYSPGILSAVNNNAGIDHATFSINPTICNNEIQVKGTMVAQTQASITIYNSAGQQIENLWILPLNGEVNESIDVSNLAPGAYMALLRSPKSQQMARFIKEE